MKLSEDLVWRGLIKDKTFDNLAWLNKPRVFYHGVDGSSNSLTIGNLAALIFALRLAKSGWQPVLLVGGATSLVGDPGGKETERPLPDKQEITRNVSDIRHQIENLFADHEHAVVNNIDWDGDIKFLDFLRDIGKHFSMTELTQREFISERMGEEGSGISYAEFSYTLIQGYDFWHLYKKHKVELQIGGSDQWGNMLSGVALIRKKENAEVHALSMPLVINKATGRKFGKSEAGAIWLDPAKTSPTQFYQFWINVDDAVAADYLKVFTLLPKDKIESIVKEHLVAPEKRIAQTALAKEVTQLVHGEKNRLFAERVTSILTSHVGVEGAVAEDVLDEVRKSIPSLKIQPGSSIIDILTQSGLASSNSEARRLVQSKAVYVNGEKFDKNHFDSSDFKNGRLMLRRGKAYKDSALIELA